MRRFHVGEPAFDADLAAYARAPRGTPEAVEATVTAIIAAVRERGLEAVLRLGAELDGVTLTESELRLDEGAIAAGAKACPADVRQALRLAAQRIDAYHQRLRPEDGGFTDAEGIKLGWRWTPLDAVGIYVPGGRAAYPSTVLMNAIPAKVAGVKRIAMASPPARLDPAVLAAAHEAGVTEIWRVGGAQAVAALAYGAGPIQPVDKIVGPGNAYVTAAKRQVFGQVGIDSLAGPSEILVVADTANDPAWIAADLLSQAEHDPDARAVLITDTAAFADQVEAEIGRQLSALPTRQVAEAAWRDHGAVIIAPLARAAELANLLAPEHLELAVDGAEKMAAEIRHAGAIFLGRHTPEALGDYVAGPNHVLPTNRAARYASGLSTLDFLKRSSLTSCPPAGFAAIAPAAHILAEAEGLPAHALSLALRLANPA
jgi:histidinol dehydrogenase